MKTRNANFCPLSIHNLIYEGLKTNMFMRECLDLFKCYRLLKVKRHFNLNFNFFKSFYDLDLWSHISQCLLMFHPICLELWFPKLLPKLKIAYKYPTIHKLVLIF